MAVEKRYTLDGSFRIKKAILFAIAVIIMLILWNIPLESFGINGLTVIQRRIIAIFAFATIMWVTEAISPWATSTFGS